MNNNLEKATWGISASSDPRSHIPALEFVLETTTGLPVRAKFSDGREYDITAIAETVPTENTSVPTYGGHLDRDIAAALSVVREHIYASAVSTKSVEEDTSDDRINATREINIWWNSVRGNVEVQKQFVSIPGLGIDVRHLSITVPIEQQREHSWAVPAVAIETIVFGSTIGLPTDRQQLVVTIATGDTVKQEEDSSEPTFIPGISTVTGVDEGGFYDASTTTTVIFPNINDSQINTLHAQSATAHEIGHALNGETYTGTEFVQEGLAVGVQFGMSFDRIKSLYPSMKEDNKPISTNLVADLVSGQAIPETAADLYVVSGALCAFVYERLSEDDRINFGKFYSAIRDTGNLREALANTFPVITSETIDDLISQFVTEMNDTL